MKRRRYWVAGLALSAVLVLVLFLAGQPDGRVHVSFLAVGQGDAILITQGSTQILVDGGPSPQALTLELGRRLPFWDRTLELVVLTHPHADHMAGLVEVLQRYRVRQVLAPPEIEGAGDEYSAGLTAEWQRLLAAQQIPQVQARAYQELRCGQVVLDVLNPPTVPAAGEAAVDDNSVVLAVRVGEVSFLLTGDISAAAEHELVMRRLVPPATVLKVAHHGSGRASSAAFLAVARPQLAVVAVGENRYGHPSAETLARLEGITVYRTDRDGTVEFVTDGQRLWRR